MATIKKLKEHDVIWKLALHFNFRSNWVIPNIYLYGGEMDVAVITPAGYLTEIEVKLSLADWKADEKKKKWNNPERRFIDRFFYAVPEEIAQHPPEFVSEKTGILTIQEGGWIRSLKPAKKNRVKLPESDMKRIWIRVYHKFWNEKIRTDE